MTIRLHSLRVRTFQHPLMRAMALLAVLGVLLAGFPRWETHEHVVSERDHGHTSSHLGVGHHDHADHPVVAEDVTDSTGSNEPSVAHVHALPALAMALTMWPTSWIGSVSVYMPDFADPVVHARARLQSPPHRPPISC